MKNIISTLNSSYPNRGVTICAADIHLRRERAGVNNKMYNKPNAE